MVTVPDTVAASCGLVMVTLGGVVSVGGSPLDAPGVGGVKVVHVVAPSYSLPQLTSSLLVPYV